MTTEASGVTAALADTSLFVAREQGRPISGVYPDHLLVSAITVAELFAGVLAASSDATRVQRLNTLAEAEALEALVVDRSVARAWAGLRFALREAGTRMPANDSWIAATALSLGIAVVTQDADYDGVPGLEVIRV